MCDQPIGIIGAGPAGLGAAFELRNTNHPVVLLEASPRIGGRLVTRKVTNSIVDTAANYITPADGDFESILHTIGTTGLVDIPEPVYTHTADGTVSPGDPDRQDEHKWTYTTGINTFAHRVLAHITQPVRLRETVESIHETPTGWEIQKQDATILTVPHIIWTAPAPQTATNLDRSTSPTVDLESLTAAIRTVSYQSIVTCVLGYTHKLDRDYYASVNTDGEHPIGWVSREECKPAHVPADHSVLVVQMAPWWSAEHRNTPQEEIIDTAITAVANVLDAEWLQSPSWTHIDRFPTALPTTPPPDSLDQYASKGLYFAGDWRVGRGRVSNAFLTGCHAAQSLTHSPT